MQAQGVEDKRQDQGNRTGHYAFSRKFGAHPIPQSDVLEGAAADIGKRQPAHQSRTPAALGEDEKGKLGAIERIAAVAAHAGGEIARRQIHFRPARLERSEKRPAGETQAAPDLIVVLPGRSDQQSIAANFGRRLANGSEGEHARPAGYLKLSTMRSY